MDAHRVAALITCHDRRELTLTCLDRLLAQRSATLEIAVFLVDDGSSDGTADAVRARFPDVRILEGDGSLYWSGGMRLAFAAAQQSAVGFSHYLWLNDDTFLHPDALSRLLASSRELQAGTGAEVVVVGSTLDPRTGRLSYGGLRRLWPLPYTLRLRPARRPRRCSTMHGNCVLIPVAVADRVGNLDPALTHGRGDIDYGFRVAAQGCGPWLASGFFGDCEGHPSGAWRDTSLPLGRRLASLREPKYSIGEKVLVARRHYGALWFLSPLAVYGYILVSHPFGLFRRGRRESADD